MSVIWNKVWFDLWHNKVRTLLVVLSIAAGVFAIGITFGMADQLLSTMDKSHQAVTPSHINMFLYRWIDRDTALSLRKIPGVADIEPYNAITLNYKIHPDDDWKQATVMMRDDYEHQRMDITELKAGQWPNQDEIDIERLSAVFYHADIGDSVTFKQDNRLRVLPIGGKVRHTWVPPPAFGGPAYFFVSAETMEKFDAPSGYFNDIYVRVSPYSDAYAKEVGAAIKEQLAKQGVGVAAVVYQDPNKHWGRFYVEGITLVLQVLAVVSLLLSVVLVFNTLTALITQQTNQIGILKAIGGRRGTIIQIYLVTVFIYGLLALLISLPLGAYLAFGIAAWFLNLFNIDYTEFQVSQTAIVLQVFAALVVPLLAALIPVLAGSAISVRQAIASYGLGGDFGSNPFDRLVERIGQYLLPSHYATALGNMFRRKGRLILTQFVLVIAGAMFLVVMSLSSSLTFTLDNVFATHRYDTRLYMNNVPHWDRVVAATQEVVGVDKVEAWYSIPVTLRKNGQRTKETGMGGELDGIPLGSDFYTERIIAGRWLQPGDDRAVVINRDTAEKNDLKVGDMVTLDMADLGKSDWQIVGLYQVVYGGGGFSTDAVYAPQPAVYAATKQYNHISVLFVRTLGHDRSYADAVGKALKTVFEQRGLAVGYIATEAEYRDTGVGMFAMVITMILALAVIVAVVGGIALMGALSISVVERTTEIGVLRAVGARSPTIMGMFMMEGVLQGIMSWAFSVIVALIFSRPMADLLGDAIFSMPLDFKYNYGAMLIWLGIVIVIAVLASILPARSATRISVRDSLAYA